MKRFFVLVVAMTAVVMSVYWVLSYFKQERINTYNNQRVVIAKNNFHSAVSSLEQIFDNVFKDKIDVDEVKSLILNAAEDPVNRDKYRNWLRIYTKPIYDSLKSVCLTHMHYHFPDGTSFLRMHRPFYFGDDLSFRSAIIKANETKEIVKGFENGRHLLAYRFIFPLKYEGAHIGSVELSVGVKELIDIMNRVYGDGYSYLLEKDKIFRNYTGTTAEELKN